MVRKPSKLKQNTDTKVDGAYADIVVPPQAKGDQLGQTKNLQTQVDAVGGPLAQEVAATGGMPNVDNLPVLSGDQLFESPTQLPNQPGNTITDTSQIFNPETNRVEVLKNIILEKYPHRSIKNRLL